MKLSLQHVRKMSYYHRYYYPYMYYINILHYVNFRRTEACQFGLDPLFNLYVNEQLVLDLRIRIHLFVGLIYCEIVIINGSTFSL
jgi:hypothetical protein